MFPIRTMLPGALAWSGLAAISGLQRADTFTLLPPLWACWATRGIKKQANEVRVGNILELQGRLWLVTKATHTQGAGRQLGNVQLELRDLLGRSKMNERRRSYDTVDVAFVQDRPFEYLYSEGSDCHLMDPDSFEQLAVRRELFGDAAVYLKEGMGVTLALYAGQPITGALPNYVTLSVEQAAPTMKGETAAPKDKAALLEGGVRVMVPSFVQAGDRVVVDTRDGSFVKRES